MIALAAVLLAAVAAHANASPVGVYTVQQMEVGGGLELRKNGRFRYALAYGAVDEEAEGDWTFDGKTVRLTSKPMPTPPSFELVRDDPAPVGDLVLTLEKPVFGEGYRLDAVGTDASSGQQGLVTTDDDGHVDSGGRKLSAVDPLIPVFGNVGGHFPLSSDRGHHLVLRFHPNDIGHAAFTAEPLVITSRGLVLMRYGTEIRFVRVRP